MQWLHENGSPSSKVVARELGLTVADVRGAVIDWWADQDLDDGQVARRIGVAVGELRRWKARAARPEASEHMDLHESANGGIRPTFRNFCEILQHDPWWSGRLRWCEFSHRTLIRVGASEDFVEVTDADLRTAEKWASDAYLVDFKPTVVHAGILWWAQQHRYHPVRAYLDGLVWDGVPRLHRMLTDHFGCADDDLTKTFGRKWMISAVARVWQPGCKVDTVLVLGGDQGMKKSTAFEALAGKAWFSDAQIDMGNKDGAMLLEGKWLIELAELDSMNRSEINTVKAFITRKADRYRAPFAKLPEEHARQCLLVGTTNQASPLKDSTGARRFWMRSVVRVADIAAIERDRDQLWAEASYLYERDLGTDHHWWLTPAEQRLATEVAENAREPDPWVATIGAWLDRRPGLEPTTHEVLVHGLKLDPGRLKGWEPWKVGEVMRELGWEKFKPHTGERRWRRQAGM